MQSNEFDLIVVGGGIAGSAAALRAAQYHMKVAWVLGDKQTAKRSRSQWVANIDNMIGLHAPLVVRKIRTQLERAGHADAAEWLDSLEHTHISTRDIIEDTRLRLRDEFPDHAELIEAVAANARREGEGFAIDCGERTLVAPAIVLATGVMDRQPNIKREKREKVIDDPKWIYPFANRETVLYCIRCEGHMTADRRAGVIGSSETAAQLAFMLHERYGSACVLLTNGEDPSYSSDSKALLERYDIEVRSERIVEVSGSKGTLRTVSLEGGEEFTLEFALVSLGLHRVYNDIARALGAELGDPEVPVEERHVMINAKGETNVRGLFAIGDMAKRGDEVVMKQVYTAQEYAVRAVDTIDRRRRSAMRSMA